jgi:large subunit ribosomal protein L21
MKTMYAVIKTGGKQYRVVTGESIKVESVDAEPGSEVTFDEVLAVGDGAELRIGTPRVDGATVRATVLAHGRRPKITIFKMRRRKHFQKHGGHRQNFTEVRIDSIG